MQKTPPIRTVKSFVKRKGRTTLSQKQSLIDNLSIYGLDRNKIFNFRDIFNNDNSVCFEIGFGMGDSLFELALNNLDCNFIGIEVYDAGVGNLLKKIKNANLTNIRIISDDAYHILNNCISNNCLNKILIFFPDPWHKKKHNKRRIIQKDFIELIYKKLAKGGYLYFATDWEEYAFEALEKLNQSLFKNQSSNNSFIERPSWRKITKFEQRGINLGHTIYDLSFRKE